VVGPTNVLCYISVQYECGLASVAYDCDATSTEDVWDETAADDKAEDGDD